MITLTPYDCIIVLGADKLGADGKFPDFQDGKYLGGHVRLKAAAALATKYPDTPIIAVGGYNKAGSSADDTSDKVNDMKRFILDRAPAAHVDAVYSLPCTHHDFVAIFNTWRSDGSTYKRIGILTNTYHLPRALEFGRQAYAKTTAAVGAEFIPISAEDTLELSIDEATGGRLDSYDMQVASEKNGLSLLLSGNYTESCLTRNLEGFRTIIGLHPDILLTSDEQRTLATQDLAVAVAV